MHIFQKKDLGKENRQQTGITLLEELYEACNEYPDSFEDMEAILVDIKEECKRSPGFFDPVIDQSEFFWGPITGFFIDALDKNQKKCNASLFASVLIIQYIAKDKPLQHELINSLLSAAENDKCEFGVLSLVTLRVYLSERLTQELDEMTHFCDRIWNLFMHPLGEEHRSAAIVTLDCCFSEDIPFEIQSTFYLKLVNLNRYVSDLITHSIIVFVYKFIQRSEESLSYALKRGLDDLLAFSFNSTNPKTISLASTVLKIIASSNLPEHRYFILDKITPSLSKLIMKPLSFSAIGLSTLIDLLQIDQQFIQVIEPGHIQYISSLIKTQSQSYILNAMQLCACIFEQNIVELENEITNTNLLIYAPMYVSGLPEPTVYVLFLAISNNLGKLLEMWGKDFEQTLELGLEELSYSTNDSLLNLAEEISTRL